MKGKEIVMRTVLIARIAAAMLVTFALIGCFSSNREVVHDRPVYVAPSSTTVVVPDQSPAPVVEAPGPAPREDATWVPGHWERESRGWLWVPGHWRF